MNAANGLYTCMHVSESIYMHLRMHALCIYACMNVNMYLRMFLSMYVCIRAHNKKEIKHAT